MKKNQLIIVLLFSLAIFSCKKEKELKHEPEPEVEYSIIGKWIWLGSSGGYDGDSYTPESTGNTLSLTFTQTDSIFIVANSDTVIKAPYIIKKEVNLITPTEADVIHINCDTVFSTQGGYFIVTPEVFNRFVIRYLKDTLRISEDCCDCYGHTFKRDKQQ